MINEKQTFSRLDMVFARFLSERSSLDSSQKQAFENLVMSLSFQQNQGHSCIHLDNDGKALILASGLALSVTNSSDVNTTLPLIIEQNRLYLHRYWYYENRLAQQLTKMTELKHCDQLKTTTETLLDKYFGITATIDWQRSAAIMAINQNFCIITGGPGTGKTTTVVKILALLQELSDQPLLIALAAPTGKAAMRLQESIGSNKATLPCTATIKSAIPESVTTMHRLLGAKPASPYFRHNAKQPLVYDLVVVDEASMVDLALMSKLLDALKPGARLILLGDKDQLASVESGTVLADLTLALPQQTLELRKSHRFDGDIKKLATAINNQQDIEAWELFQSDNENIALLETDLIDYITQQQIAYLQLITKEADFSEIYKAFNRFQALCATRLGKNSVSDITLAVEKSLSEKKLIHLSGLWYSGRPIMITQNNAALQLYNGDIGICLRDKEQDNQLRVFFQQADGSIKKYLPARIPHCETVFVMTIHKSQGSEFDEVLIILPETHNPILTKELLYTAITRAKKTIKLVANASVFYSTVRKRVQRVTGLAYKFPSIE
ncbi:MAG: exodeoxyribonuclease V subunit alpha [Methylococcales bacterium]|nr:MAG: exodeoxyribonuclease V subunit alpha [Methylococcales bacterium]